MDRNENSGRKRIVIAFFFGIDYIAHSIPTMSTLSSSSTSTNSKKRKTSGAQGPCCFYFKYGKCEPPRGACRFRHDMPDDGVSPCCFGATCRLGHASRVFIPETQVKEYWEHYREGCVVGISPAMRDATLLRSQLEPWPTAVLRERLVEFGESSFEELDGTSRGEIMERLLEYYREKPRKMIRVLGTPVNRYLLPLLLEELKQWRTKHTTNTRPSISAESYMILRSPLEFGTKDSNNANTAAKKLSMYKRLWELSKTALSDVDPEFANSFSALAVTYNFQGSPHLDKQNTRPFYGLSLGDFPDGQGGVCVEVDAFTVARVNTKHRLGKIDGRFPHWVGPYDDCCERFSLIYYSTWQQYVQPTQAFFGSVVEEEEEGKKKVH